jgi:hypothetical protein
MFFYKFDIQASELVQILENIFHYTAMWRYVLSLTRLLKGLTHSNHEVHLFWEPAYIVPSTGNFTEESPVMFKFPVVVWISEECSKQNLVNF